MKHYVEKIMANKSLTETEMEGAADLLFLMTLPIQKLLLL